MTIRTCHTCHHKFGPADDCNCTACNRDADIATRSGWEAEIATTWAHHPAVMAELAQQQAAE